MTIQTREVAIERARKKKTNEPGTCQHVTRDYYDAESAGDRDHDKDADANDGWLSEPAATKHAGDRNPPPGVPLYFKNKSGKGEGHRAISLPGDKVRSTDFNGKTKKWDKGKMGTGTIEEIEKAMSLVYVGWSETITGHMIPSEPVSEPTPEPSVSRGENIDAALDLLDQELKSKDGRHKRLVHQARRVLQAIPKM